MKLIIYFGPKGYNIATEDGEPMEFVDGSQTQGITDLKEAISQCVRHDYKFEVV